MSPYPFDDLLASLRAHATARLDAPKQLPVLFTTDASGLFELWLAALPEQWRREYTCSTCRAFMRRFGGLVTIDDKGRSEPLLWRAESTPEPFRASVRALAESVAGAPITGVFMSTARDWGAPESDGFQHF